MHVFPRFLLCGLLLTGTGFPQDLLVIGWLSALQECESRLAEASTPSAAQRSALAVEVRSLYRDVHRWASAHSLPGLTTPSPLASDDADALRETVRALRDYIEESQRRLPGGVFQLGRIEVNVEDEAAWLTSSTVTGEEIRQRDLRTIPDALNLVPGVSIQRIGARNERGVFIRGFDMRQVPLYTDGIPVYVPYDGYVDMDRFLTYDVSEIQVSKGFTSPLYGPNAIGGAVNLISKAPVKPFTLDVGSGYAAGDAVHGFANTGLRWKQFWLQGGFAWLSSDGFPLSGKFSPVPLQPAGRRVNSYQTDNKTRIRLGWTPSTSDQYSLTYAIQQGEKGNPPYAGDDPAVQRRFWQWPSWDKESFYFIGNKSLGEETYLRARFYYDKFDNLLRSFDDACYCTQTRPFAFNSPFDDDTYGTTPEVGTRAWGRHTLRSSFYFKDDTHREGNIGTPLRSFRDQTFSLGVEDTIRLSDRASVVLGFSADRLQVLNAQQFVSGRVLPFDKNSLWTYNPQAGVFYALTPSSKVRFTFARKTRLPTIKDRYSFRMGFAIPNPDLQEERSSNWEAGFSQFLGLNTYLETSVFRSNVSNSTQQFFLQPNLFQFQNVGEARFLGGELGLRGSFSSNIQWNMNYTYLSRRNTSHPALIFADTPRHQTYASATWLAHPRLSLLADLRYEGGRYYQNQAGRFGRATNYATAGIGATSQLYRGVDLQVELNNLFDRNYILQDGYPETGRAGYLNLRYRF